MTEHVLGASWFILETEKGSAKRITEREARSMHEHLSYACFSSMSPFSNAPFFRFEGSDTGAQALSLQNNFHVMDTNVKVPSDIHLQ